jgi:hypothetical protein
VPATICTTAIRSAWLADHEEIDRRQTCETCASAEADHSPLWQIHDRPEAIMLQFECVIGIVKDHRHQPEPDWANAWQHISIVSYCPYRKSYPALGTLNVIHVTCDTTSSYAIDFKRALDFGEGQLSSVENTSLLGEGLTGAKSDSAAGNGIRRGDTAGWWTTSPLRTTGCVKAPEATMLRVVSAPPFGIRLRNVLPCTRVSPPESSRSANCVSFGSTRGITSLVRLHGIFVRHDEGDPTPAAF